MGADASGNTYNINADTVAHGVAAQLKADALVLCTGVPGVLRRLEDPSSRMPTLARAEAEKAVADGVIAAGMIPKVDSAVAAIQSGVEKVQFVDGRIPHSVLLEIFTHDGVGTMVVDEKLESVREATMDDVSGIVAKGSRRRRRANFWIRPRHASGT